MSQSNEGDVQKESMACPQERVNRRGWLRLAGRGFFAAGLFQNIFSSSALAGTWRKIGKSSGGAMTWRKLGPVTTSWIGYSQPACGYSNNHALRADGTIWSCGYNAIGQLGNNSTISRSSFVQASGTNTFSMVAGSWLSTMALRSDGVPMGMGNNNGKFGNNSTSSALTFVAAVGISNIVMVSSCGNSNGTHSTFALRADGAVFSSGQNDWGLLGINSTVDTSSYVQAVGISNAISVKAGDMFSMALRTDGRVFATGFNFNGQIGNNTSGFFGYSTYQQATGVSNVIEISAAPQGGLALRSDGTVWGVGSGSSGQLGENATVDRSTFVQAVGLSGVISIAAGSDFSMALKADGTLFSTGANSYGQLGSGDVTSRSSFVQVVGISNIVAIAAGFRRALALRSDGKLFATGYNWKGSLGDGTTVNRSTFVQVLG